MNSLNEALFVNASQTQLPLSPSINQTDSRKVLRDQKLEELLKYSPGLDLEKMKGHLERAEKLQAKIATFAKINTEEAWQEFITKNANPEAAIDFAWLLFARAAENGDIYTNGAISLQNGARFEEFLLACGKANDLSYSRISTHLKHDLVKRKALRDAEIAQIEIAKNDGKANIEELERLEMLKKENITQYGIDLRDMGLPAGKHTILFARQSDGSLFFKTEKSGCPPFWKSFHNLIESLVHLKDLIVSKLHSASSTPIPARKEKLDSDIGKLFKKVLTSQYPQYDKKIINEKFNMAKRGGLQQILKETESVIHSNMSADELQDKADLKMILENRLQEAQKRGLQENAKIYNNEIIIGDILT